MVFLPTSSPSPDFFGGRRPGDNRYANSIVALRGSTGQVLWHFQVVHHDVWDLDVPSQPILAELERDGKKVPVVIQLSKSGMVFVFHRETGEPFFPIEERPVPTDGVPGEQLSPTQPFPVKPAPLVKQSIEPDDAWGVAPNFRRECREKIEKARHGSIYTPPTTAGLAMLPGSSGGMNWGGGAFDPASQVLVTPVANLPFFVRLVPKATNAAEIRDDDPMAGFAFGPPGSVRGSEYALEQRPLMSKIFTPCVAPPWSELVAVDMKSAEVKWRVPLGTIDKLSPVPIPFEWGTPTGGGPIVTAGGIAIMAGTADERIRAWDLQTGQELWKAALPTSGMATPMTYEAGGRQFVVVAAGGHMFLYPQKIADYVVAYALP
jgi:quinoprotein glucose dehydrogenase